jgi:sugar fermentation stimulation protein A
MKILLKIENYEKGVIIERLNRFVVKVKIKNRPVLAHLNNTGRLEDFLKKGKVGLFLPIKNKLKFRLSMINESKNIYSIIDTQLQMKCFEIALEKGYISWLKEAKILKRNFRTNDSLIDYLIEHKNKKYFLEIKSAVMKYKNFAMYPDCPSIRGQKHIKELINIQSTRITDRINYPNNSIYPNEGLNNIPEYRPNNYNIYPNNNRMIYPNNRPNKNKIFGKHSGNPFGPHLGSDIKFGPHSGKIFGQNSGKVFGEYSGKVFGQHSGSDIEFGQHSGNEFGIDSGKVFGQDSDRNINTRLSALYPYKSVMLFIAGMKNISSFSPNKNADPKIYELLKIAKNKGVKIKAIQIYFDEKRKSVVLKNDNLPVVL